ncbi:MAG: HD domain-containing protein, partial [Ktedonobacterales bacterium]
MTTSDSASARRMNTPANLRAEDRLLRDVEQYLRPGDIEHVTRVLAYANELDQRERATPDTDGTARKEHVRHWDVEYGVAVAETLADAIHIDAISLAAVLLYQAVEGGRATLDDVSGRLGADFGDEVAQTIKNIARFDMLQRPATAARRSAQGADGEDMSRDRIRSRERARRQDAENIRRMIVAMSEDPRVAVFKIADQLRLMRAVYVAAEYWREHAAGAGVSPAGAGAEPGSSNQQ